MTPKRGDRAAPPPLPDEYDIRFDNGESAKGWESLARSAPANLRRAYDALRAQPRPAPPTARHHALRGSLARVDRRGVPLEQWQYEVTGGGRIWYLIDDVGSTLWITYAGTAHPRATDS
ncbi:hypothetical protein MTQ13_22010 [Streptomyces sp. XM4011]|jgi:hypothetical protein|uniref:hypothetical protein n=1 Tax=Streptomyces TaxID=1883 RepID=UPI001FFC245F|nr:hypothetical protein [Streptomyces sp. XM4011]MCK1816921.1 hypothetical protein [Streptomyces sp. XM4011]